MKYSVSHDINQPRDRVVSLLTSHEHRRHWQHGFVGAEALDGEPGTVGATTLLKFKVGDRPFQLIETILERDLPDGFTVSYVSEQSASISRNSFVVSPVGGTRWHVDMQIKVSGLYKLMAFMQPHNFKDQTLALMKSFSDFAES